MILLSVSTVKRLLFFILALLLFSSAALSESSAQFPAEEIVYGLSESGRDLICYRVGKAHAPQSLLLTFGLHGFEDAYDHDGEVLRLIAHRVIDHFSQNPSELGKLCLYVVPSANPDGLLDGTTHNGFGRCNAAGLDINRDFPAGWSGDYRVRYKTGDKPFSSAEARAIRDLVGMITPTYGVDIHGWIDAVYGSAEVAKHFAQSFDMRVKSIRSGGTLAQWLDSVLDEGVLLELPPDPNENDYVDQNSEKLIGAIRALCAE